MSNKLNLEIEQGASFSNTIDLIFDDNSSFDVSGWSGRAKMKKHEQSNTSYSFQVDLSSGQLILSMNASTTNSISKSGLYIYDVEIEHTDGTVKRVVSGLVTVSGQVTK